MIDRMVYFYFGPTRRFSKLKYFFGLALEFKVTDIPVEVN